jgi:CBS domain-containing protein
MAGMTAMSVLPVDGDRPVREVCNGAVVGVETTDTLFEAAQLMSRRRVGALVVFEDGLLRGVLSEADLINAVAEQVDLARISVEDFMTPDAWTIGPQEPVSIAAARMRSHAIHHLPVVDLDGVVGMLSLGDILAATGTILPHPAG